MSASRAGWRRRAAWTARLLPLDGLTPPSYTLSDVFSGCRMERNKLVESFLSKRERLNQQAHRLREQRDRLNDETKRHAGKRDELNAQVRSLVERANAHKARRDANNQKVREAKGRRDELNKAAHAKVEALQALRRERGQGAQEAGVPLPKLRAEIKHLEYQQQTTVLTPKKERELIELIAAKLKELKEREAAFQESGELKAAYEEMRAAKAAAEEAHAQVTQLANEAQGEHDAMVKLFAEADALRKQADGEQAEFVRHKVEADKVHREYIETVTSARDLDRVVQALRGAAPQGERAERGAPTAAQRAEAEDIFEKFRKGEKLSTEDLIALQKGGRL
ncbi:MAG TPA: phosphoserine phosphatase [Candidatus Thermoplasmatota archaeon]|nr:phosphoserine phosphatase [Candidatus Thermoplasmatota archaeon]